MAKCLACGKSLSPTRAAACSTCPCIYHKECVGIISTCIVSKAWVCPECAKKKKKGNNSNTPVKAIGLSPPQEASCLGPSQPMSIELVSPTQASDLGEDQNIADMRRELAAYMAELREFRQQFRTSIETIIERMDGFERRLEALEQREASLKSEEVIILEKKVAQLQIDLSERDQDLFSSDLDIGHLPEEKGENIIHSITLLATRLGVTLEERDIVFAERVGAVGSGGGGAGARPRRVVVRLARGQLRDDILRAARVRRTLTTADAGSAGSSARIYINERLTRNNRHLFHLAREECRKRQWRYAWTRRGRVYVRKVDGDQVYPIRSDTDIARVFGL